VFDKVDYDVDKMWNYLKTILISNTQNYIPMVSKFCQWKKTIIEISA